MTKSTVYEDRFLQQALNEVESLREENTELKRKLLLFEQLVKDLKDILKGEKIECITFTEEVRKKISEANKGNCKSEETKRKMSEAMKGLHKGMHWKVVDNKRVWY